MAFFQYAQRAAKRGKSGHLVLCDNVSYTGLKRIFARC